MFIFIDFSLKKLDCFSRNSALVSNLFKIIFIILYDFMNKHVLFDVHYLCSAVITIVDHQTTIMDWSVIHICKRYILFGSWYKVSVSVL